MRTIAVIGVGYWGKNLARNFSELGALHTVCDSHAERLLPYDANRVTDSSAVFADPEIKQVVIATPSDTHFELAKEALLAGKDVYVEKPICHTVEQAQELVDLAATYERILMVGHILQYHPCVEKLLEMVREGVLGKLQYVSSHRLNWGKILTHESSLWALAPHDFSVLLAIAGEFPERIDCTGVEITTPGIADKTMTHLQFPGGLQAHVYTSWLNPFKEQKLTVVGDQGAVVFDDTLPWGEKLLLRQGSELETVSVEEKEPLKEECRHFLDCCVRRVTPRTDGEEALRVLKVLNQAHDALTKVEV